MMGVILGCFAVYFMLIKDRDRDLMGWIPSKQVLKEITAKYQSDSRGDCLLQCIRLSSEKVQQFIDDAEVHISKSQPRSDPQVYWIQANDQYLQFEIGDSLAGIVDAGQVDGDRKCDC